MPKYYDLNVKINNNSNLSDIKNFLLFFKDLGYNGLGIDISLNEIGIFKDLKKEIEDDFFKLYSRINIKAKSIPGLKKALKNIRLKYDLIGIECWDINVCHWAVQDSRPDIIIFNNYGLENYNYSTAKLIRHNKKAIEISLKNIIFSYFDKRSKLLRQLIKRMRYILKSKALFLLTTQTEMNSIYNARAPRDLIALMYLIDIPTNTAIKSISKNSEQIIKNALDKRDPNIISENIRIIQNEEESR